MQAEIHFISFARDWVCIVKIALPYSLNCHRSLFFEPLSLFAATYCVAESLQDQSAVLHLSPIHDSFHLCNNVLVPPKNAVGLFEFKCLGVLTL